MTRYAPERFWCRALIAGDGCWVWQRGKDPDGYGIYRAEDGRQFRAHRFAWVLVNGEIPAGQQVLHGCDNPSCVRPDHLFLGTNADNMADRDRKGRQARPPATKLTREQVAEIRAAYALGGITQRALGERYGVNQTAIQKVVSKQTWRED